jgi:eukaryotic-like serine/threonine-protein kinase
MVLAATDCHLAGRYRLCRRLADGGMGQVWQAVDELLHRPVAVKLPRDEHAQDPAFVGRLRAEARYAAAVSHPGITSVFDYGEARTADGAAPTVFLVMELVQGAPLSALLAQEGRLGLESSLDIVGQAALALGAAHRAGLVHRDIKPANLLVRADGVVKVTDFGVAWSPDEEACDPDDALAGTAGYLSPEQAVGRPATPASDVYALGVVAYECLAGRRPFTGDHPIAVALAHLTEAPPPLPDDVPAPVVALVGQAMAKEPRRRPCDAWSFARRLLALRVGAGRVRRRDRSGAVAVPRGVADGRQPVPEGEGDRLQLGVDPELDQEVLHVGADRRQGHVPLLGDAPVGPAAGEQAEDLQLPV